MSEERTDGLNPLLSRRALLGLGVKGVVVVVVAGCGGSPAPTAPAGVPTASGGSATAPPQARPGGQITFALGGDPDTLDPHTTIAGTAWVALNNIYDGLFMLDYASQETPAPLIPGLAESYKVSSDGRTYTFELRKNVKFHDGTPWNAEAAVFNFRRWFDKGFQYYYPKANSTVSSFVGGVKSYKAVGESTFEVVLEKARIGWFDFLTKAPTFFMVSPEAVKKSGNDAFSSAGVGTGPFIVEEYKKNERLVLRRNPDYWGGAPLIEKLVFVPVTDESAKVAGLVSGEFDIAQEIPPDSIPEIEGQPNLAVQFSGKPATFGLGGNMKEKPWSDARVREAVSLAIDRKAISEQLLRGAGVPATQFYGLGNSAFEKDLPVQDPHDPEKAKALMKEAGYGDGFDMVIHTSTSAMGVPEPSRILEQVQRDLAGIGIRAEINTMEWTAYLGEWIKGVPPAKGGKVPAFTMAMGWDTNMMLYSYAYGPNQPPNGVNFVFYKNEAVDRVLDESQAATDPEGMNAKMQEAQRLMLKDRPYVFIFHSRAPYGVNKRLAWTPASAWAQNLREASVTQ